MKISKIESYIDNNQDQLQYTSGIVAIDLAAIVRNYKQIRSEIFPTKIIPVLKSNAYGIGSDRLMQHLHKETSVDEFFVATIEEGVNAKRILPNAKIYVLSGLILDSVNFYIQNDLIPVINTFGQLKEWSKAAKKINKSLPCILHIDTGMSRTGLTKEDAELVISSKHLLDNLNVQYLMSHLSCGEIIGSEITTKQYKLFEEFAKYFPFVKKSISATPVISHSNEFRMDMVRIGYGLYGFYYGSDNVQLEQSIYVYTRIVQIREIYEGDTVGYGATYIAKKKMKLATLSIGYGDGYHRFLHNYKTYVYIDQYKAYIVGRISMDFCVVDVSDIPDHLLYEGRWVQILGGDIRVSDLIQGTNFVPHEVPIFIGGTRYFRVYLE